MHEQMDRREGAPEKRNIAARSRAASSPKGSGLKQTRADRENQPNLRVDHFNTHDYDGGARQRKGGKVT